jgi:acetoin utilization protein AcuB
MTKDPKTISPDSIIFEAVEMMQKFSIRHIPVMENDELIGLITESNLRKALLKKDYKPEKVRDIMIRNPITIDYSSSIDHAAKLINEYRVGGLPVLEKRKFVGIFTTTDLVNAFISILGINQKSVRLDISILDKNTHLEEIISLIRKHGVEILSIIFETLPSRKRCYIIRVENKDIDIIINEIEKNEKLKILSVIE